MIRKLWELIALLIALVVVGSLVATAVQPFLPILGIVVITAASAWVVRFFYVRSRL